MGHHYYGIGMKRERSDDHYYGIGMKRERSDDQILDPNITNMANCLMILQAAAGTRGFMNVQPLDHVIITHELQGRVFECKTCNRKFPSFQALGGHRASHKKPRQPGDPSSLQPSLDLMINCSQQPAAKPKPKTHECSICGQEFAIGQALGGHMRRHRAATLAAAEETEPGLSLSPPHPPPPQIFVVRGPHHVLKRSNSSTSTSTSRSSRICLDLNLTPKENGMDYPYPNIITIRPDHDKLSPILHCYL